MFVKDLWSLYTAGNAYYAFYNMYWKLMTKNKKVMCSTIQPRPVTQCILELCCPLLESGRVEQATDEPRRTSVLFVGAFVGVEGCHVLSSLINRTCRITEARVINPPVLYHLTRNVAVVLV